MRSYFFVPSTRDEFVDKIDQIPADEIILDFEDSVSVLDTEKGLTNAARVSEPASRWVRPRLFDANGEMNTGQLEPLFEMGYRRFFLPKIETVEQLENVLGVFEYYEVADPEWILIIESPLAICNVESICSDSRFPVKGVVLGVHDYAAHIGMSLDQRLGDWARARVLNAALAYGLEPIDVASMQITDSEAFQAEVLDGFRMGYAAKVVVHPRQLDTLRRTAFFTDDDIATARKVASQVDFANLDAFSTLVVDGVLYECMHLRRIQRILDYAAKRKAVTSN